MGRYSHVRRFFAAISTLGDWYFWAGVGALLVALRGVEALPLLPHLGVTAAVGVAGYKLLKGVLIRERPFVSNGRIQCGTAPLDRYSFPSGHTLHATSFTVVFAAIDPAFLWICLPFALLVAASRVILGLHYPTDVLAGAVIGVLLGAQSVAWL